MTKLILVLLVNFGTKFHFKLRMTWHLGKIGSNLYLSLHSFVFTCQILGRNFFQVRDDVTTRTLMVSDVLSRDLNF
ncbi:hypothetical protein Hanom_Chr15g01379511 [Helianthus anomalus]